MKWVIGFIVSSLMVSCTATKQVVKVVPDKIESINASKVKIVINDKRQRTDTLSMVIPFNLRPGQSDVLYPDIKTYVENKFNENIKKALGKGNCSIVINVDILSAKKGWIYDASRKKEIADVEFDITVTEEKTEDVLLVTKYRLYKKNPVTNLKAESIDSLFDKILKSAINKFFCDTENIGILNSNMKRICKTENKKLDTTSVSFSEKGISNAVVADSTGTFPKGIEKK